MEKDNIKWVYLILLSIIWGSSFILIKKALVGLTPLQVGSLRIVIAGVFLFIIGFNRIRKLTKYQWKWVAIAGFLGTFFPAFFFAFAQTEIDSAITSILNATTPIMTLIFGAMFFAIGFSKRQLWGVLIGLAGCLLLIWQSADINPNQNYWYVLFIFMATVGYAMNVNVIKTRLQELTPLGISAGSFFVIMIPALIILISTGFFKAETLQAPGTLNAAGYIALLAIFGTALALLVFNKLIQISTPVFSTSVTYTIPIVALLWGIIDGEQFSFMQLIGGGIILVGVVLANSKKRIRKTAPV
ncbi:DMT family transporter [Planktosalinus lacus]|uniref:Permease n=1 Tax=Planktosalinus lacus TaxID=1526573 RepID=A0A8J2VAS5_9FLAO|nr:EamA family transporter [Planktosalinus lacus]GGD96151.1 permease [Planktosalinus lacus]